MRVAYPAKLARVVTVSLLAILAVSGSPAGVVAGTAHGDEAQETAPSDTAPGDTLTLAEAVWIGLGEDPDVRVERADREAASAARLANYGSFLPNASVNASFSRSDFTTVTFAAPEGASRRLEEPISGVRKSSFQSLGLDWTLLDGGRRIAAWRRGGARLEAARHRVSAAERQTAAGVKLAFLGAREQRALVDAAERRLQSRREDLRIARKRYAIAAADRSEILGARSDTLDARMQLLEARRLARQRTRELRVAMGVEPERIPTDVSLAPITELPPVDSLNESNLLQQAARSHPELEALAAEARAASADLWAARADYLPAVNLGFDLGRSEQLGREGSFFVLDPSNTQQGLSLTVSWNLFDGFQREQQTRQASATLSRTRAQASKRRIELRSVVRNRLEELRRRQERLSVLRQKLEVARERVDVTRERFRLGDVSYLDLQQVLEQLDAARREQITERFAYLRAWVELERVAGPIEAGGVGGSRP